MVLCGQIYWRSCFDDTHQIESEQGAGLLDEVGVALAGRVGGVGGVLGVGRRRAGDGCGAGSGRGGDGPGARAVPAPRRLHARRRRLPPRAPHALQHLPHTPCYTTF